MTDNELVQVTREIDNVLAAISLKYQIPPLSIAAIVNARLIWACRETGTEDDYHKLLNTIQSKQYDVPPTAVYTH